jgi:hypothetical protein
MRLPSYQKTVYIAMVGEATSEMSVFTRALLTRTLEEFTQVDSVIVSFNPLWSSVLGKSTNFGMASDSDKPSFNMFKFGTRVII